MEWDVVNMLFGAVGALGILLPALVWLARRVRRLSTFSDPRLATFLDDWFGEPERPGFPRRLGVPERLGQVEAQVRPNHGSSLRDVVDGIARQVAGVDERVRTVEQRLDAVERLVPTPPDRHR